jgi:hypothetical protein
MSLTELIQKIHQLSPEDQAIIRRELDSVRLSEEQEAEEMAAIEEGLRSSREERSYTLEEAREEMHKWRLDSK